MAEVSLLPIHIMSAELHPTPIKTGASDVHWLMQFTAQIGPFLFSGVGLGIIPDRKDPIIVGLPYAGRDRRCVCTDPVTRKALKAAAFAAYRGLGGLEMHAPAALPPLATAPTESSELSPT